MKTLTCSFSVLLLLIALSGADEPTYEKRATWRESLLASRSTASSEPVDVAGEEAKSRRRLDGRLPATGFWRQLRQDFPGNGAVIMAARDWLRRDRLEPTMADSKFAPATRKLLDETVAALDYVRSAGGDVSPAEKAFASIRRRTVQTPRGSFELYLDLHLLRRRIVFSHPSLDFERILINVNPPTTFNHNGDQFLARHSRVGKGLAILADWKGDSLQVTYPLEGKMPAGAFRSPDLNYDADRVLFAFAEHAREIRSPERRFFLYEAALDGSWVKQLTGTSRDPLTTWDGRATVMIEDNDPCYLPDGGVVFLSTRSQTFGRCHGGRYNPAWVLHRCDANGDNIRQLSFGNENEMEPSVLNDGRIVFTRWEYTNRHEMWFHKLWWCRPDGTSVSHFFGNDMRTPHEFVEASAIPGSHKVVATGQGHHSYNTGTIVVIDPDVADNGEHAITHITPETPYSEDQGWPAVHYSTPYPVTEELFLASRANHRKGGRPQVADRGIYLVDPLGGRELIYEDPDMASFSPIALRKRVRPPVLPSAPPHDEAFGTVFLQNAYLTRNDPEGVIQPGMIKALRINALGVQPRARRSPCSGTVKVEIPKKVLGTVPVNEDGSAFFKVPAGVALQVQTLDENGMAILTEKSFFYLQPGENRSCIGCHEPYGSAPVMSAVSRMSRMQPAALEPPAGPSYPGGLSFMRTVQPVLDRYCIGCHGLGDEPTAAGGVDLVDDGTTLPRPYRELIKHGNHRVGDKGFMQSGRGEYDVSRPRRFYAFRNKVSHMLLENHGKCNMDRDSTMRIIEWLDLNAQCYGDLFPNKLESRRIDPGREKDLREAARSRFGDQVADQPIRALINVAQIDESRILMAPLATEAGGWGQLEPEWSGKEDPEYLRMAELVDACIRKSPRDNVNGWEPTLEQGGGEDWVMKARESFGEGRSEP